MAVFALRDLLTTIAPQVRQLLLFLFVCLFVFPYTWYTVRLTLSSVKHKLYGQAVFALRDLLTTIAPHVSCHSLQIKVGRYKNIPRENRLCNFCPLNEIEDEKHFIFCPLYENLRKDLFDNLDQLDNFTWRRCTNEMEKFLFLVQPCNKEVALLVCKYLKSCFDLRKQKMSGGS